MAQQQYDYGMIGLGTMGRNLAFNMSDHGFTVAGFDKDAKQVEGFAKGADAGKIFGTADLSEFIAALKLPRTIILLVPAGKVVDIVIDELTPLLSKFDLLMDWGNSHYTDTNLRIDALQKLNIHFMGVGISGGESGARNGPSIMPGGPKEVYARLAPMLEAVAAKVDNQPCVTWLGPGSSGHYVKMVHNGIEYGIMQLISECYHLLKTLGGLNNDELHQLFQTWGKGRLHSFLVEITADVFAQKDDLSKNGLVDMILDRARQKGTGAWTSEDAMNLQVPIPLIDAAVSMRAISAYKEERVQAQNELKGPGMNLTGRRDVLVQQLEQALYFAMITAYAQGMSLLHFASKEYKYDLKLKDVASIWRGGCIIRASMLDNIFAAFSAGPDLSNMMHSKTIADELMNSQAGMRSIIKTAVENGIPVPGMMASIAYYDAFRSGWLPANLIQAQRDYFGAHTYERIDKQGVFHTHWNQTTA